jgi:hypothetical protein
MEGSRLPYLPGTECPRRRREGDPRNFRDPGRFGILGTDRTFV